MHVEAGDHQSRWLAAKLALGYDQIGARIPGIRVFFSIHIGAKGQYGHRIGRRPGRLENLRKPITSRYQIHEEKTSTSLPQNRNRIAGRRDRRYQETQLPGRISGVFLQVDCCRQEGVEGDDQHGHR